MNNARRLFSFGSCNQVLDIYLIDYKWIFNEFGTALLNIVRVAVAKVRIKLN
jgi:hypothetical protein